MSLHYNSGKLLLKNETDSLWYYLYVALGDDSLPHLHPDQISAGDFLTEDYDEYAVIRADNGDLYKISLYTNGDGVVTYKFDPIIGAPEQQPVLIYIKDPTTGIMYRLLGLENQTFDGRVYPSLVVPTSSGNRSLTKPCFCPSLVSIATPPTWSVAQIMEDCTLILPPSSGPVTPSVLGGEGGEEIGGEAGGLIHS